MEAFPPFQIGNALVAGQKIEIFRLAKRSHEIVLGRGKRRPVCQVCLPHEPRKAHHRARVVERLRGADHRLGWHAADIDACAADRAMADQRHIRAPLGSGDGCREPGRARADNGEVIGLPLAFPAIAGDEVRQRGSPAVLRRCGGIFAVSTNRKP